MASLIWIWVQRTKKQGPHVGGEVGNPCQGLLSHPREWRFCSVLQISTRSSWFHLILLRLQPANWCPSSGTKARWHSSGCGQREDVSKKKKKVLWLWSHQPLQMPPSHGESENSGWIKTGYWPWIVKMHIKGTVSMNPDSYIFSYIEKHKNHSLEMSSLVCVRVISSNLWVLQYVCFFFSPTTSI